MAGATTTRSASLADPHVRHLVDVVPDVGGDRVAGQRRPGRRADELAARRAVGHDPDVVAALGEQPEQLAGLVGGDAAADAEDDPRAGAVAVMTARRSGTSGRSGLGSIFSAVSRPALISRSAIDSGFSCDVGLDQRADVLEQALAELGVVGVDLAGALGGVDDQAVLGVGRWRAARRSAGW